MGYVLCFVAGLIIGAVVGVATMALCAAGRDDREAAEMERKE
ncbi:MAG: DUF3789 domain-containing protein [Lachnospiraceae bacterium]|nr:DUF3789 domain-containing protein [Lachnospiraceae bacterium]